MLPCALYKNWTTWTAHTIRGLCLLTLIHKHTDKKLTHKQKFRGDVCRQARTLGHKKALLTNPPSSTNKSHWFANNTSPWMHSPTRSVQPHTSTINNLHNKRPLCGKAYSLGFIAMIYSFGITHGSWFWYIYDAACRCYWSLCSLCRCIYKRLLCRWRASRQNT